jgi:hypothetical protein
VERIMGVPGLVPQQIVATVATSADAALIDQWGRVHRLAPVTQVGRNMAVNALTILHASVSRRHADLILSPEGAIVRDLGSANGTTLNDERFTNEDRKVSAGDILRFGGIGFYWCQDPVVIVQAVQEPPEMKTSSGIDSPAAPTIQQPIIRIDTVPLRLFEPAGGGGGVAEMADRRAQLGEAQYALLNVLLTRFVREQDKPEVIRGFIRSSELMELLPWDTAHPSDNHLKQLVRRTRRALEAAGMGDLIESKQRFGYRLRLDQ